MIHAHDIAWLVALLAGLCSSVATAKVTSGAVMIDHLEVRAAPSPDSAVVMTLRQGAPVLVSKIPPAPPGWLHVMQEDASAEMRHGYVPLGTVGVMTLRTSSDAFAAAQDGTEFPGVRVQAELNTFKCKRMHGSPGKLESCVVRYFVRLDAPAGFNGHALTSCTTAIDFVTGDGSRATATGQEQLAVISPHPGGVEGSVELATPREGAYEQAVFGGIACRLEKAASF